MSAGTALVTGATRGIGFFTALGLAERGYDVVVHGRDRTRTDAALADLRQRAPSGSFDGISADLSSQAEVRRLATDVRARFPRLSVLVNNAGLFSAKRVETVDGVELVLAVNHIAPFLLGNSLLDLLRANAPARIVNVNSSAHLRAGRDVVEAATSSSYTMRGAYGRSKLANLLYTKELARRLESGVTVNALHPGLVKTGIGNLGGAISLAWRFFTLFAISPERGAATSLYVATSPEGATTNGGYFDKSRPAPYNPLADDRELAARMWEVSEQLTRRGGA
jgi:NAD(P)-dependent dehydrogenase (short-subunit alcohol dehydrogenase family)